MLPTKAFLFAHWAGSTSQDPLVDSGSTTLSSCVVRFATNRKIDRGELRRRLEESLGDHTSVLCTPESCFIQRAHAELDIAGCTAERSSQSKSGLVQTVEKKQSPVAVRYGAVAVTYHATRGSFEIILDRAPDSSDVADDDARVFHSAILRAAILALKEKCSESMLACVRVPGAGYDFEPDDLQFMFHRACCCACNLSHGARAHHCLPLACLLRVALLSQLFEASRLQNSHSTVAQLFAKRATG
jgi:hypothetical protein